ncbi:MAG: undecaprenyl-diphosphate phosphatase [Candidatus Magasanikbacteria bacterium]|jgi:undecaprenyl-diphosphatase
MSILHAIVFGMVEGITEFLPISSTGHLILTADILRLPSNEFQKSFEIIIQLGAILAVVVWYWKKLWQWETIAKLAVAFAPTAVLGLAFYRVIKHFLLGNTMVVLGALFLGGVFLVVFEWYLGQRLNRPLSISKDKVEPALLILSDTNSIQTVGYLQSFIIGLFQSIAMIPGVSRSAATIVGGLILGLNRQTIVEFSFLLAVPTMLAASCLDIYKSAGSFAGADYWALGVGFVVSFFVALAVIQWLLKYIQKNSFISFGVYRIIIAVLFWVVLIL